MVTWPEMTTEMCSNLRLAFSVHSRTRAMLFAAYKDPRRGVIGRAHVDKYQNTDRLHARYGDTAFCTTQFALSLSDDITILLH